jgi:hypothetical protein
MSDASDSHGQRQLLIFVINEDPLRARSDARELLTRVFAPDLTASLLGRRAYAAQRGPSTYVILSS